MRTGYVAIIGRPNVGKSTLLNRFIGEKLSIVTPKPQTTRQNIIGIYNKNDAQAVFLDTPGFHETKKPLNLLMIEKIGESLKAADVILLLVESKINDTDLELHKKCRGKNIIIAVNKIDRVLNEPWESVVDRVYETFNRTPTIAISAERGDGCDVLLNKIISSLPEGEPFYPTDQITEHPWRFLTAEIVREQAFELLHQELPYSLTVKVDDFKEPPQGTVKIYASIIVERESQKGMVIGAGGKMIKEIGSRARKKIEEQMQRHVYLELQVKVVEGWTKDTKALKKLFIF